MHVIAACSIMNRAISMPYAFISAEAAWVAMKRAAAHKGQRPMKTVIKKAPYTITALIRLALTRAR